MGLLALGIEPGDEILVPAYSHGSEIEALVRAGIVCRFYDIGHQHLGPDEKDLEALLSTRVRALYLTHYLGIPLDAARWRAWCDERNLLLIEDAAQAWLSSRDGMPVGSHADLSIFCLYKTFGLPDGAAVISSSPPELPRSGGYAGISRIARQHGLYLAQRWRGAAELSRWLGELRRRLGRLKRAAMSTGGPDVGYDPQRDFALGDPGRAPHPLTGFLLPRVAKQSAQAARASNYAFLLEHLAHLVPEQFAHPVEGASPFAFPVRWKRKDELLQRLARRGIAAENFWAAPHPRLHLADFPSAAKLKQSIVALPVHQELGIRELERVVYAVLEALGPSAE